VVSFFFTSIDRYNLPVIIHTPVFYFMLKVHHAFLAVSIIVPSTHFYLVVLLEKFQQNTFGIYYVLTCVQNVYTIQNHSKFFIQQINCAPPPIKNLEKGKRFITISSKR